MEIYDITIRDIKKHRPDIYEAIKEEVCLGELRLTKDDIISMIEPLSENLKEYLKPYLSKLPSMTYNDIVDMENDIIDEIAELLLNEFEEIENIVKERPKRNAKRITEPSPIIEDTRKLDLHSATLEDLKKNRSDLCELLYSEFFNNNPMNTPSEPSMSKEEVVNGVKKGDVIRWNYTKEKGIVVGFEDEDGISNIIVQRYNGTKVLFENDPKLFTILEGKQKDNVISERDKYKTKAKERKDSGRVLASIKKAKTIYDGVMYDGPTRKGSKLNIGDRIRFNKNKESGIVKGFMRKGGLDRIVIEKQDGKPETILDYPEGYEIIETVLNQTISHSKTNTNSAKSKYYPNWRMEVKKAEIGDVVQRKSDGLIGTVIDIKDVGYGIERLILELEDGSLAGVFNETSMYYVLIDK